MDDESDVHDCPAASGPVATDSATARRRTPRPAFGDGSCPRCQGAAFYTSSMMGVLLLVCGSRRCGWGERFERRPAPVLERVHKHGVVVARILAALVEAGEGGVTTRAIAAATGTNIFVVRARLTDLKRRGLARDTGRTAPSRMGPALSIVVATETGREYHAGRCGADGTVREDVA